MDVKPEPLDPDREETTLADEQWPVAEHYRVEPTAPVDAVGEPAVAADANVVAVAVAEPPRERSGPVRRFPPDLWRGELVALIAVVLLIAAATAVWLVSRADDDASATATPSATSPAAEQPATPPTTSTPPPSSTPGKTVPEVVGMTLDQARPLLRDAGLRVRVERVVSEEPPGTVLLQSPSAGQRASGNDVVVLTVAGEPERVVVPRVLGLPASEATDALRDAGLRPELRTVRSTESAGAVIGQTPAPNEEVDRDTVVTIEIATPPKPPQATPASRVEIPRLVGLTSADARSSLRELGLRSTVTLVESAQPEGTVIGQAPRAGAQIEKGGTVTLRVSSGPATVAVPDVVGVDEQTARQQLEDAGFVVETVDEATDDSSEDGIVVGQTPSSGAQRATGTVVTLRVARSG